VSLDALHKSKHARFKRDSLSQQGMKMNPNTLPRFKHAGFERDNLSREEMRVDSHAPLSSKYSRTPKLTRNKSESGRTD
jgi:hypothetical protein